MINSKSKVYKLKSQSVQMNLFEQAGEYLANKALHSAGNSAELHCRR